MSQVESLLSSFLKDVGITEEQFMAACKDGSSSPQFSGINRVCSRLPCKGKSGKYIIFWRSEKKSFIKSATSHGIFHLGMRFLVSKGNVKNSTRELISMALLQALFVQAKSWSVKIVCAGQWKIRQMSGNCFVLHTVVTLILLEPYMLVFLLWAGSLWVDRSTVYLPNNINKWCFSIESKATCKTNY